MKKVSRFANQAKWSYGAVAPSSSGGIPAATLQSKPAVQKFRDYFDDDDEESPAIPSGGDSNKADDEDYDPLDDFM